VVDAGACPMQPTTVIDLSGADPVLLRVGRGDPARLGIAAREPCASERCCHAGEAGTRLHRAGEWRRGAEQRDGKLTAPRPAEALGVTPPG
jgi:hypothetical protein